MERPAANDDAAPLTRAQLFVVANDARNRATTIRRRWNAVAWVIGLVVAGFAVGVLRVVTADGFGRADVAVLFWIPTLVGAVAVVTAVRVIVLAACATKMLDARRHAVEMSSRAHATVAATSMSASAHGQTM